MDAEPNRSVQQPTPNKNLGSLPLLDLKRYVKKAVGLTDMIWSVRVQLTP